VSVSCNRRYDSLSVVDDFDDDDALDIDDALEDEEAKDERG